MKSALLFFLEINYTRGWVENIKVTFLMIASKLDDCIPFKQAVSPFLLISSLSIFWQWYNEKHHIFHVDFSNVNLYFFVGNY